MLTINEIKNRLYPIIKNYPVIKVTLFGSYARGDATESSDIDLVIDNAGMMLNRKIFALGGELLSALPVRVDVYDVMELNKSSGLYERFVHEGVVIYDATG